MSRLMMLMLDCQHVDCYMIYRIARYFDQLGFLGAAPCLEVELFLACLVLVWIPGPWEGVLWSNQIFSHGMVVSDSLSHFVLFFSWEISVIFYFRPFFGRWMTLVAASLISTRTKLWLIADASLGVFLFFSHFSPGCTDISLHHTLSYCIYYIDIVYIYIYKYIFIYYVASCHCMFEYERLRMNCFFLALGVWISVRDSRTAGATKKPSPSLRPSIRRQRLGGVRWRERVPGKTYEKMWKTVKKPMFSLGKYDLDGVPSGDLWHSENGPFVINMMI